ncbi:MAG: MopE-related protein [Polyangiaceae bacterium]
MRLVSLFLMLLAAAAVSCGKITVEPTGGAGAGGEAGGAGGSPTTSAGGAGAGGATGGQGGAAPCETYADCAGAPGKPLCDVETGKCVQCLESTDCDWAQEPPICDPVKKECVWCYSVPDPAEDCGVGYYCKEDVGECNPGCTGDADCPVGPYSLCDVAAFKCVMCFTDTDCAAGTLCDQGECVPGCETNDTCPSGQTCCSGYCHDLASDVSDCGACDVTCATPHGEPACEAGQCVVGACTAPHADCDLDPANGCEVSTLVDGDCVCVPGTSKDCYLGLPGTEGVGPCKAGTQVCGAEGLGWGPCTGQVLPMPEICANGVDDDCDGTTDNLPDADGDGFTFCDGDCNDLDAKVNPAAAEVTYALGPDGVLVPGGNGVDDDCNPLTLDTEDPPPCSFAPKLTGVTAMDLAAAMDLCQLAQENPPLSERTWGLLSAEFRKSDGSLPDWATLALFADQQSAVLSSFGAEENAGACDGSGAPINLPFRGPTMAAFSSGRMRAPGDADYVPPGPGTSHGTPSACPADYLAKNGGMVPNLACGQTACPSTNECYDGVSLRLRVRVPTNAKSFSIHYRIFSAEYPERLCSPFNDAFLALVSSLAPGYPADKNVAFDALGNPPTIGSMWYGACEPFGCLPCPQGTSPLSCTGMSGGEGGATEWLQADWPVVYGETMTLDLMVFDGADAAGDTHVLVDKMEPTGFYPIPWGDH